MTEREMAAVLRERGWGTIPPEQYTSDIEESFLRLWRGVEPFTMTYLERGYALYKAVEYICRNRIPGDFVSRDRVTVKQECVDAEREVNMFKLWCYQAID